MKKLIVFFVLFAMVIGSSFAQSINNSQKLIGTWMDHTNILWVFNSNDTYMKGNSTGSAKYGATETQLVVDAGGGTFLVFNYSISSDGKTLILITAQGGSLFYLLTRR